MRNLRNQIAELTSRYLEQSNALELRDTELDAMSKDLANMAKENQAVNEGAGSLRQANQALSRRFRRFRGTVESCGGSLPTTGKRAHRNK